MSGAFQSNAFQNDAFQVDSAFTGGSGQAQCDIKQTYYGFGQAQTDIKQPGYGSGQAQCDVKAIYWGLGQAQCDVKTQGYGSGQANCYIQIRGYGFGQSNAQILAVQHRLDAKYLDFTLRGQIWDHFWQDTEEIITTIGYGSGQAQTDIKQIYYGFSQAQCDIKTQGYGLGQAQCDVKAAGNGFAQAQCAVKAQGYGSGQANCDIKTQGYGSAQAQCTIRGNAYGQAQCDIKQTQNGHGQAQCQVQNNNHYGFGQAQCFIPGGAVCLTDEFDRIVASDWGTGNIGAWTTEGSNGVDSVDGTYGLDDWLSLGFGDFYAAQEGHRTDIPAPAVSIDIWEVQIDFFWADATGGTSNFRTMTPQFNESSTFDYGVGVDINALAGTIGAFWYNPTDDADDPQSITVDLTAFAHIKLRYEQVTGIVSAKYWEDPDSEPAFQSTVGGVDVAFGATPIFMLAHNSLQTAPSGLTTSTPLKVDTLQFCYGSEGAITAGYGQAQALICAVIVRDTFSRVSSGNPGTPDVGPDWGNELFSEYSLLTTNGSELILTGNSDYDFFDGTIGNNLLNGEVSIDFNLDVVRNWATIFDIVTRVQAEGAFSQPSIQAYSYYDPDENKFFLYIQSNPIIDVNIEIDPIDAGEWYRAKVGLSGDTISVKVWKISDPEPDWLLQATGAYIEPGIVEFFADVGEAGSYPAIVLFDNVYICSTETIFTHHKSAQAQAFIRIGIQKCGQAQADIKAVRRGFGQAQCKIILTQGYGQANAKLIGYPTKFAQANALILKWAGYGQAMTDIRLAIRGYGQALCLIDQHLKTAQVQCFVHHNRGYAQAQCLINAKNKHAQAQCNIVKYRQNQNGQATCLINSSIKVQYGQAQAYIYNKMFGQAQAKIQKVVVKSGQAQADIRNFTYGSGQALTSIHKNQGYGQAQCFIYRRQGYGQAQCFILRGAFGQAQCRISGSIYMSGQTQCIVFSFTNISSGGQASVFIDKTRLHGQSQAYIQTLAVRAYGQAQCMLRSKAVLAQAQCRIVLNNIVGAGQARAVINNNTHTGQAATLIDSPVYAVKYNGRFLPGYAQSEAYDSIMNIYSSEAAYMDLKFSEYTGLQNKVISLQFKAWTNNNFVDSKESAQLAATIVRSNRTGFVPLYIRDMDKHYLALTKKFATSNDTKSTRTYDYEVEFECKPWLITDQTITISGTGLIDTGSRTLDNGGWTPTRLRVTGTNVTVSGYTAAGDFTGFISISGGVSGLEIDSEAYIATIAGVNKNDIMNIDYALYVGPGKTYFNITGANDVTIEWEDRHYL